MANILDKKQDVIDFQLTKYGRKLLSLGTLKPFHVGFFDDSIIYDMAYGGGPEIQNDIVPRILNDTLTLSSLTLDQNALLYPLGNSARQSEFAPAWNAITLRGNLTYILEGSSYFLKNFNLSDINYSTKISDSSEPRFLSETMSSFELEDGRILEITDDYILLEIEELNVDEGFKNFEIELYIEEYNNERQLSFIETPSNIIDDMIYDEEELPTKYRKINLSTDDCSFFLDVLVDEEISQEIIQGRRRKLPEVVKGTYTSMFTGPAKDPC